MCTAHRLTNFVIRGSKLIIVQDSHKRIILSAYRGQLTIEQSWKFKVDRYVIKRVDERIIRVDEYFKILHEFLHKSTAPAEKSKSNDHEPTPPSTQRHLRYR